jgi:hypothetical protein
MLVLYVLQWMFLPVILILFEFGKFLPFTVSSLVIPHLLFLPCCCRIFIGFQWLMWIVLYATHLSIPSEPEMVQIQKSRISFISEKVILKYPDEDYDETRFSSCDFIDDEERAEDSPLLDRLGHTSSDSDAVIPRPLVSVDTAPQLCPSSYVPSFDVGVEAPYIGVEENSHRSHSASLDLTDDYSTSPRHSKQRKETQRKSASLEIDYDDAYSTPSRDSIGIRSNKGSNKGSPGSLLFSSASAINFPKGARSRSFIIKSKDLTRNPSLIEGLSPNKAGRFYLKKLPNGFYQHDEADDPLSFSGFWSSLKERIGWSSVSNDIERAEMIVKLGSLEEKRDNDDGSPSNIGSPPKKKNYRQRLRFNDESISHKLTALDIMDYPKTEDHNHWKPPLSKDVIEYDPNLDLFKLDI